MTTLEKLDKIRALAKELEFECFIGINIEYIGDEYTTDVSVPKTATIRDVAVAAMIMKKVLKSCLEASGAESANVLELNQPFAKEFDHGSN